MQDTNEIVLYTVKEAATILHTNKAYIYSLIKAKMLPAIKLGSIKIRRESLDKFLSENEGYDLTDPKNIREI